MALSDEEEEAMLTILMKKKCPQKYGAVNDEEEAMLTLLMKKKGSQKGGAVNERPKRQAAKKVVQTS